MNGENELISCETIWERLSAYVDGDGSREQTEQLEAHLAICSRCARELVFLRSLSAAARQLPEVVPPATLRSAIFAATTGRKTPVERLYAALRNAFVPSRSPWMALAGTCAAAALVFALLLPRFQSAGLPTNGTVPTKVLTAPEKVALRTESAKELLPLDGKADNALTVSELSAPAGAETPSAGEPDSRIIEPSASVGRRNSRLSVQSAVYEKSGNRYVLPLQKPMPIDRQTGVRKPGSSLRLANAAGTKPMTGTHPVPPDMMPEVMPEAMPAAEKEAPTNESMMKETVVTTRLAAVAPKEEAKPKTVVLTASISPDQAAALVDLRTRLRKENENWEPSRGIARISKQEREIRVDVLKGSF